MRSHRLVLALAAALALGPVHQPAAAAEVHAAAYQFSGPESFSGEELIASGHHFFGMASKGLAMTVEEAVRRWGEPNGYIVGQEASAAIFGGLRYGEGMLYTRTAGERRIYWQGPSLGFDLGGDAGRTMMLVYHLPAAEALFGEGLHTRFVGLPGFKWSSQHLERGGCDDCSEAAFGSVWAKRVALAWSALCCAA